MWKLMLILMLLTFCACTPQEQEIVEEAIETTAKAPDQALEIQTKRNLKIYGAAIDRYIIYSSNGAAPDVYSISELESILKNAELINPSDTLKDGWGNPLVYERGPGQREFKLVSYGANGKRGGSGEFDKDLIYSHGSIQ